MKTFTMVAKHGMSKDNITGFTLISPDYQTIRVSSAELGKALAQNKIVVNNLAFANGAWKSTNGALDNYMLINDATNMIEGTPKAVILDRVEQNNKLLGYTVFTQTGTIVNMSVADAVLLANNKMLSNGKIRHTESGDIVSAIGGNYPLRELRKIEDAPKGETTIDLMFFGQSLISGGEVAYFGAIVSCSSATEMTKLTEQLSHSNASVISTVVQDAGQNVRKSLAIQRMGVNSLYGVFKVGDIKALIGSGAKVNIKGNTILVSSLKYKKDGSGQSEDEATIKLDKSGKVVSQDKADDNTLNVAVEKYAQKIASLLGTINK